MLNHRILCMHRILASDLLIPTVHDVLFGDSGECPSVFHPAVRGRDAEDERVQTVHTPLPTLLWAAKRSQHQRVYTRSNYFQRVEYKLNALQNQPIIGPFFNALDE